MFADTFDSTPLPPYQKEYLNNSLKGDCSTTISNVASTALFIIGCIALVSRSCPPTMSLTAVGLAGIMILENTYSLYPQPNPIAYLTLFHSIACIVVAALVSKELLSGKALGWTVVGPFIAKLSLFCCCCCGCCCAAVAST